MVPSKSLLCFCILLYNLNSLVIADKKTQDVSPTIRELMDLRMKNYSNEFQKFCFKQKQIPRDPTILKEKTEILEKCQRIHQEDFHLDDLHILFSLFAIIMWGALVRTLLRITRLRLPYTVVLLASGIVLGIISRRTCLKLYKFTVIGRLEPTLIFYSFLPVLIFESAFGISSHVFMRAKYQVLLLAVVGMIICTGLTTLVCYQFFTEYKWSMIQAALFGSIISATDPVAVVAILKELGVAESLSVIVDAESLFNDGIAILFFEVFKEMMEEPSEESVGVRIWAISLKFLRIAVGGPAFGFLCGKITIFSLKRIFNDAVVEITITLASAYLTYYLAEAVLGVSGVCAITILGITLSAERTCITPEIFQEVQDFWEMLSYLANTVLFMITGIVIGERASRGIKLYDLYYNALLYFAVVVIRLTMLLVLNPLLDRTGYNMSWPNLMVLMWSGLRGAVGICLSLSLYENVNFCDDELLGQRILLQTAGIVVWTLLLNGTTTRKILDILEITSVTPARSEEMEIAVKHLLETQSKGIIMRKHDRYLADANWEYVENFTMVENPYKCLHVKSKRSAASSLVSFHENTREHPCQVCNAMVPNEPSNEEYRILTEDARVKIIKALKISYWTQFEQGILTETAVRILGGVADSYIDKELTMLHVIYIRKLWQVRGIIPAIRKVMIEQFGPDGKGFDRPPPEPTQRCRRPFWWLATRPSFDTVMSFLVFCNMLPVIWEYVRDTKHLDSKLRSNFTGQIDVDQCDNPDKYKYAFRQINCAFFVLYLTEFIIKIVGRGCKDYWSNSWNYVDFFILVIAGLDRIMGLLPCKFRKGEMGKLIKGLRLLRIARAVRLIKTLVPAVLSLIHMRINGQLFLGYDILLAHLRALDDVLKYLSQLIENAKIQRKFRDVLTKERMECIKEIGFIQRDHPGSTLAVKTRHASRSVLNQMRLALHELRTDGLLDGKENKLLAIEIDERMKRLHNSPKYISPSSPKVLLDNLIWVSGNEELKKFINDKAILQSYELNDSIVRVGDAPDGLHVIISGMVKIVYEPEDDIVMDHQKYGCIPNMEIYQDYDFSKAAEDFLTYGSVINEAGVLTGKRRTASAICETEEVKTFFIPIEAIKEAFERFKDPYDSLESRLWRSCGIRRGYPFLPTTNFYKSWKPDKLRLHLERSFVPIGSQFNFIEIPAYVLDAFVIEGVYQDFLTGELFVAPSLVSRECTQLLSVSNPKTVNRILFITQDRVNPDDATDEFGKCVMASYVYRRNDLTLKLSDQSTFGIKVPKTRERIYKHVRSKLDNDLTLRRRPTRAVIRLEESDSKSDFTSYMV